MGCDYCDPHGESEHYFEMLECQAQLKRALNGRWSKCLVKTQTLHIKRLIVESVVNLTGISLLNIITVEFIVTMNVERHTIE